MARIELPEGHPPIPSTAGLGCGGATLIALLAVGVVILPFYWLVAVPVFLAVAAATGDGNLSLAVAGIALIATVVSGVTVIVWALIRS